MELKVSLKKVCRRFNQRLGELLHFVRDKELDKIVSVFLPPGLDNAGLHSNTLGGGSAPEHWLPPAMEKPKTTKKKKRKRKRKRETTFVLFFKLTFITMKTHEVVHSDRLLSS